MGRQFDPLWVPILSHYAAGGTRLHEARCEAQIDAIKPFVRSYLIAGTTGDGWAMDDSILAQWLSLCSRALERESSFLIGAFAKDTAGVISRVKLIEAHFSSMPPQARFAGLTLCAPVQPGATQRTILRHFRDIMDATTSPVALYELPQVTGCKIAPETVSELARDPRIVMVKDTSGRDLIAQAGLGPDTVSLVRGAEGDYAEHLAPSGPYDGWLLSTANGFGEMLRNIADAVREGRQEEAVAQSARLSLIVNEIFAAAGKLGGNAFADANRAVDHLRAYGQRWRAAPAPLCAGGSHLTIAFIAEVAFILEKAGFLNRRGYLDESLLELKGDLSR